MFTLLASVRWQYAIWENTIHVFSQIVEVCLFDANSSCLSYSCLPDNVYRSNLIGCFIAAGSNKALISSPSRIDSERHQTVNSRLRRQTSPQHSDKVQAVVSEFVSIRKLHTHKKKRLLSTVAASINSNQLVLWGLWEECKEEGPTGEGCRGKSYKSEPACGGKGSEVSAKEA